MAYRFSSLLLATLLCANPLGSSASADPQTKAMEAFGKYQAEIDEAIRRGELIYKYDQAAWHSTYAMLEEIKDPAKAGIKGWVVSPAEHGLKATYFGIDSEGPVAIYSAVWTGAKIIKRKLEKPDGKIRLSAEEARLAQLLRSLSFDEMRFCNKLTPNSVTLPRQDDEGFDSVYIMTPQPSHGTFPLGGHNRVDIKNGNVVGTRKFMNSCLDMNMQSKEQKKSIGFTVSHLLDPTPTEIHVFTALAAKKPVYVMTTSNDIVWLVEPKDGKVDVKQVLGIFGLK